MHRLALAAVACIVFPAVCRGQVEPSVSARGPQFIVLEVGSSTSLGLGLRVGARTDLVLEGGVRILDDGDTYTRGVFVRPAVKRYWGSTDERLAPYLTLGLRADWSRLRSSGALRANNRRLGGLIGVGLDWFPVQRVSVGGHIGLEVLAVRSEGPTGFPPTSEVSEGHEVGTYSSGVRVRLSF